MTDKTYNGWTNYETWRVNLEIFDSLDPRDLMVDLKDPYDLGQYFKEYVEDMYFADAPSGRVTDWASAFVSHVDWYAIARHKIAEYAEEEAAA